MSTANPNLREPSSDFSDSLMTEFSEVRTEYLRLASCTHRAQAASEGDTLYMSIFPTKILLATDGSKEAKLASTTAADLAKGTGSELHVLYVGEAINPYAEEVGLAEAEAGDFERHRTGAMV
jgi:hypothetical protein